MNFHSARRIEQVQDPVIPIIGRLTAEHPGTISLGQGVVHYAPPLQVRESVIAACESDASLDRYGDVCGNVELLDLIKQKLAKENGISLTEDAAVVCTSGANMAFLNAIAAIADPDDEIVLLSPYYFNHQMAIEIAGCRVVVVPTKQNYQMDLAAIESAVSSRTRAIVTVSPNNPTGAVYPSADLRAVNELCRVRGIYHISDEAYEYFVYDGGTHYSPASHAGSQKHTISIFSLSKGYGMAGWRAAYMVVPEQLLMPIKKVQDTNLICPPRIVQSAMMSALQVGGSWCKTQAAPFEAVRNRVFEELAELTGIRNLTLPQGAFYFLLGLDSKLDSMQVCEQLIRQYGVAVLPGSTFGVDDACSIRLSYGALAADTVMEGVGRLVRGLEGICSSNSGSSGFSSKGIE